MADYGVWLRSEAGTTIPLQSDREIRWRFRFGGTAVDQLIAVSEYVDRQIQAEDLGSYWSLVFAGPAGAQASAGASVGSSDLTISNIEMVRRGRSIGGNKVIWHMADKRRALAGAYVDTFFNKMKVSNDFNRPATEKLNENVSIMSKAGLNHFIPFTCMDDISTVQRGEAAPIKFSLESGRRRFMPWTALTALTWFLSSHPGSWLDLYNKERADRGEGPLLDASGTPFSFGDLVISESVVDRRVLLKNWNPRSSWPKAINYLSRMARVGLYVNAEGSFVVEDLTPVGGISDSYGKYRGAGGVPVETVLSDQAPRSLRVFYPEFQEIRWDYDEKWAAERFENKLPPDELVHDRSCEGNSDTKFMLENVLPLPQDVKDSNGKTYKAGTWINIFHAIRMWKDEAVANPGVFGVRRGIYNKDPGAVFSYDSVLKYSTTIALAHLWQRDYDRPTFRNQLIEARVAAIYQHFRKTFRIPAIWLDHIETVRAERSTIYANVSRSREPSPVYLDYNAWDSTLYRGKTGTGVGQGYLRNVPIDGDKNFEDLEKYYKEGAEIFDKASKTRFPFEGDAKSKSSWQVEIEERKSYAAKLSTIPASPARVSMVDPQRGVFSVGFTTDFSGVSIHLKPGMVDPRSVPVRSVAALGSAISFQGQMVYAKTFRLMTILSVRWRTRNTSGRHFVVTNSESASGASTPGQPATGKGRKLSESNSPETYVNTSPPQNARGPDLDVYTSDFEAFRKWEYGKVKWVRDSSIGQMSIDHGGAVQNIDIIDELSSQVADRVYFRFRDIVLGTFRASRWTGQMPLGNIREVSVTMSPAGALETEISCESLPATPSVWEHMSGSTRNVVAKFEADVRGLGD